MRLAVLFSALLFAALLLYSQSATPPATQPRAGYTGDAACTRCHSEQALSYVHTMHHLTSQMPDEKSILGSFAVGKNILKIADPAPIIDDPGISYRMEKRSDGYYVNALTGFTGKMKSHAERIDVVIGSGHRGQTYLYWKGDALFELPVSYWTDGHQWINSPGYRNGPPYFDRPASPRCMECHAGFIQPLSPDPASNHYNKTTLQVGIGCETCHGPGARHVELHQNDTAKLADEAILNPAHFSRDRQVDLCALCHNGAQQTLTGKAFGYIPGQPLDEYLGVNPAEEDVQPDVHANQVALLKKSRCYLSSPNMSCSTCHDVHSLEKPAASYSTHCLGCHKVESCGMSKTMGHKIADNCIDCHMPIQQTGAIVSQTADRVIRTTMRTHWIKVYPQDELLPSP